MLDLQSEAPKCLKAALGPSRVSPSRLGPAPMDSSLVGLQVSEGQSGGRASSPQLPATPRPRGAGPCLTSLALPEAGLWALHPGTPPALLLRPPSHSRGHRGVALGRESPDWLLVGQGGPTAPLGCAGGGTASPTTGAPGPQKPGWGDSAMRAPWMLGPEPTPGAFRFEKGAASGSAPPKLMVRKAEPWGK